MNTQVLAVANRIPDRAKEPYYRYPSFLASLERFRVKPMVLGMGAWWGGLMTKPRRLRQWLRVGHCTADRLIICDAFDVVFTAHPDEVAARVKYGDAVVFNAEKGLFPRADLEHAFPECGTPWRYLNSGVFVGKPARILALLEAMNLDDISDDHKSTDDLHGGPGRWVNPNDQGWFQYAYAAQPVTMRLDSQCNVLQTLSGCSLDEFDLSGAAIKNAVTGTQPLVWHFNGNSKDLLMDKFLQKWGLP